MESSFTEILSSLGLVDALALMLAVSIAIYFTITRQTDPLMFLLVLSASLVGSTIPILGNIAPLIRWLTLFLLFFLGLWRGSLHLSFGFAMFGAYVVLGFISLFWAHLINYQIQRSILLFVVAGVIPLVFTNRTFRSFTATLKAISLAASIYCLLNFLVFPTSLGEALRFYGLSVSAATFAVTLGALLPFTLWGLLNSRGWTRAICILGFVSGTITLVFSGQRTGTVAGIIGLIPLFLAMQNRKTFGWSILLVILLFSAGYFFFLKSDISRILFLFERYNPSSGLSGREWIWQIALAEIGKNPVVGHGIGAAEMVFSSSFHNAYLEVWYNTGFLGLLLYGVSQVYFLYRAVYTLLARRDTGVRTLAALAIGYMAGFVAICLFESIGAGASSVNLILYLFLGFVVSSPAIMARAPLAQPVKAMRLSEAV